MSHRALKNGKIRENTTVFFTTLIWREKLMKTQRFFGNFHLTGKTRENLPSHIAAASDNLVVIEKPTTT